MKRIYTILAICLPIAVFTSCTKDGTASDKSTKEAVDLGLSVKWASCNIGASTPYEYGDYFAWADTEGDYSGKDYCWSKYKWGNYNSLTKYNRSDRKTVVEKADDAAQTKWGDNWRMPTISEWRELMNNCEWEKTSSGIRVTSRKNGKSIFLPTAGRRTSYGIDGVSLGFYWSSSLVSDDVAYAQSVILDFNELGYPITNDQDRFLGHSIRPVTK